MLSVRKLPGEAGVCNGRLVNRQSASKTRQYCVLCASTTREPLRSGSRLAASRSASFAVPAFLVNKRLMEKCLAIIARAVMAINGDECSRGGCEGVRSDGGGIPERRCG